MLSVLASVLVLGLIPPEPPTAPPRQLPGIEVVSIAAPSEEIFSVDPDTPRPNASTAKIMTALLTLENHETNEIVTIPPIADEIRGSTLGVKTGQQLSVRNMLYGLLLPSANDAAYALAVFDARSVGGFVKKMNERAASLGLKHTHFANPAGLDSDQQFMSPRDLAMLTLAALKNPTFATIVGTRTARITALDGTTFDLKNTNEMLHYNANVFGVKTGTTDKAGECLVILFTERDRTYLLILLGSRERYADGLKVLQAVHTVHVAQQ
jgi:D-alanyl-D-alanine carboxypeptidase (penicillin-binding protein 5/6)